VTASPLAQAATAIRRKLLIQRSEAGGMGQRHQEVPPGQSNQASGMKDVAIGGCVTEAAAFQAARQLYSTLSEIR